MSRTLTPSRKLFSCILYVFTILMASAQTEKNPFLDLDVTSGRLSLTVEGASHFARLALHCIDNQYPNKISHVLNDDSDARIPQELHPAFYGCFDWHSSVHGHWMLIRLLKLFPGMPEADQIRKKLNQNLTAANIQKEVAYFSHPSRKSFERTYGWAWLLKLIHELDDWDDVDARKWSQNLQLLADAIVDGYLDFLPKQNYAIRTGEHPNTAFGLSFAWDYAISRQHKELKSLIELTALKYYGFDVGCPANWEPGGADFLSPCLEEANLMRRVLSQASFDGWFGRFLPALPESLRDPATVVDRSDGKLVHLDGLNLSRAWCMLGIASVLKDGDPRKPLLLETANRHIFATLPHIASGEYAGEHWLASFAVYVLSL